MLSSYLYQCLWATYVWIYKLIIIILLKFLEYPGGLPVLLSFLLGCLHCQAFWWDAFLHIEPTDGLPVSSLSSLPMGYLLWRGFWWPEIKILFCQNLLLYNVHAWNSLSMVKSNSNLTKSGRSAFIIPSRPLLKGGRVVLEHHPPTRFNMNEVYALYIFLPTFLDIRPIHNLCRFRTQVSGKQNNNFRVCGHTDSIPILPWMIMSESTTKLIIFCPKYTLIFMP